MEVDSDLATAGFLAQRACQQFAWGLPTHCALHLVATEEAALAIQRSPALAEGLVRGPPLPPSAPLTGDMQGAYFLACMSGGQARAALLDRETWSTFLITTFLFCLLHTVSMALPEKWRPYLFPSVALLLCVAFL